MVTYDLQGRVCCFKDVYQVAVAPPCMLSRTSLTTLITLTITLTACTAISTPNLSTTLIARTTLATLTRSVSHTNSRISTHTIHT